MRSIKTDNFLWSLHKGVTDGYWERFEIGLGRGLLMEGWQTPTGTGSGVRVINGVQVLWPRYYGQMLFELLENDVRWRL